jgi:hypothetical protein
MTIVYNIDTDKEVTPVMVRDAVVRCFFEAHCADAGLETTDENINKSYCLAEVRKAFVDDGMDFDQPTKAGIMKAMQGLIEFSKNFRDQSIIKKHQEQMMLLVEKLK